MLNARSLSTLAVLLGAIGLVVGLISPRPQGQFIRPPEPVGGAPAWWPPHPRDQVQFRGQTGSLAPEQEYEVFVVPTDRWLVLLPQGPEVYSGLCSGSGVALVEDVGGVQTIKSQAVASGSMFQNDIDKTWGPLSGPLGWTFAPGSTVLIKNTNTVTFTPRYSLLGYLTPL